jgi:hypothetical protein
MAKTAQHNTSTQRFTEIHDIKENIVLLEGGGASIVMEITATNFALLSREEQDGKMFAYASLLNSLSFPVQILVRSKRIQILPYLKLLDSEQRKATNPKLSLFIKQYRDFIENLVTVSTVLDKQFYCVISYSSVEGGIKRTQKGVSADELFFQGAKTSLRTKADSVMALFERVGLRTHILGEDELTKLFYDIYNQGDQEFQGNIKDTIEPVIVERQKTV